MKKHHYIPHSSTSKKSIFPNLRKPVKFFLGGLPPLIKKKELKKLFKQYGKVKKVELFIDYKTMLCKGFGNMTIDFSSTQFSSHQNHIQTISKNYENFLKKKFFIEEREIYIELFLKGKNLKNRNDDFLSKRIYIEN